MNFFKELDKYDKNIAIITEGSKKISYKDLLDYSDKITENVDRSLIFIICKNSLESIAGYIGFMRKDAVCGLIDDTMDVEFIENIIERYKPRYIYLPDEDKYKKIIEKSIEKNKFSDYRLLIFDQNTDYKINPKLALLLTTSGSTGSAKFVRLSYENIYSNARSIIEYLKINDKDRPITTLSMSYSFGLSVIHSHLLKGATIILTESSIIEKRFWDLLHKNKATNFSGVPFTFEMLKRLRFQRMNLPTIRYITQAGGRLDSKLSKEFIDICLEKGIEFFIMYGQTEASPRMSYLPWKFAKTNPDSIGIAVPGGKLWIEDDDGKMIDKRETVGELIYKGNNVFLGYAKDYHDLIKDDENNKILKTGDLATFDSEGLYYIVGRKKRFIKLFGKRVNLDEVEHNLKQEGFGCACVGNDDNLLIYIDDESLIINIKEYVTKRLGINNSGFDIVHIEKIPRNKSGKILYSKLNN